MIEPVVTNIEHDTKENTNFRKAIYTGDYSQVTVMSLKPGEDIGSEVHSVGDQFIRIEQGKGKAVLDGTEYDVEDDFAIVVPAGVEHNVINTGNEDLKLYSIYSPAEHPAGTIHPTKADAEAAEHHH